jgi:hypothetical protein
MTTVQRLCRSLIAVVLLGGCGSSDESRPSGTPVEEKPLGEMTDAMDKARAVQDTTLQHKEDLDRALQDNGG